MLKGLLMPGLGSALGCALLAAAARSNPEPILVWNASASVPIGLYALRPAGRLHVGELVAARPPKRLADWLDRRDYLPKGLPLLKHIAALQGQTVCRQGLALFIDGAQMARAQERDRLGRLLPVWRGCRTLRPEDLFLLNPHVSDSLDGRYFGVLSATIVIGRAVPLWTKREP